jgi:hypothetical protein
MTRKTRSTNARPGREERLESAALRSRMKKGYEKAQQEEAFKELLFMIGANGGKLPYGAMNKLIKKYQANGFKAVTRQNLYYRLEKSKEFTARKGLTVSTVSVAVESHAVFSDLTGDTHNNSSNDTNERSGSIRGDSIPERSIRSNIGGRKKGSTAQAKVEEKKKMDDVVTQCAFLYCQAREKAKKLGTNVPDGTLKRIVEKEEEKAGLASNSVSLDTIRSRVKRGNPTAYNPTETPPLLSWNLCYVTSALD